MDLLSELFQAFISSHFDNDGAQLIKPEDMQSFPEPLIGLAVWLHNHQDCWRDRCTEDSRTKNKTVTDTFQ